MHRGTFSIEARKCIHELCWSMQQFGALAPPRHVPKTLGRVHYYCQFWIASHSLHREGPPYSGFTNGTTKDGYIGPFPLLH